MELTLAKDPDYQLFVLLRQVGKIVEKAREKELQKKGISLAEHAVLFITQSIGYNTTPAEISRWMIRQRNSISTLLNRMEKKGLIKLTRDLDKKNLIRVSITKKGQKAYEISTEMESIHSILSVLPNDLHPQMIVWLKKFRDQAIKELGLDYQVMFP